MSRIIMGLAVVAAVTASVPSAFAEHTFWKHGSGSCQAVCQNGGGPDQLGQPYFTGQYTANGNHFYICRADAHGEGKRPGFNVRPSWSDHCYVAHVVEEAYTDYDCLCTRD
jgi:hypothetical protein